MGKNKILHIINGEFYSGAERVQDLLALTLPKFGYECGFACLKPRLFPEKRWATDAPVHDFSMRSKFDLSVVTRMGELIRAEGYDLVHTHTPRAAIVGRLVADRAGVSFVHHVHSPTSRDTESKIRNYINSYVENWSLRKARYLLAVSSSLDHHIKSIGFSDEIVKLIPNGVPIRSKKIWIKPTSGQWVVGMVALFRPRKGLEILLHAISILRTRGIQVHLRAVGGFETQNYQNSILSLIKELEIEQSVTWVGFTKDVGSELELMDLFVLPSLFGEGLPMVLIEAMAIGLPVVGTSVEGIPEVLRDEAGIVVSPNDSKALASGIEKIINLDEHATLAMIAKAYARQQAHYSEMSMAAGVAAVYDAVLKNAH